MRYEIPVLLQAVRDSWSIETSYCSDEWSEDNKARGQCLVTCLVLQDFLGGELLKFKISGNRLDEKHFVNQLPGGVLLDATASQYTGKDIIMKPSKPNLNNYESVREKRLDDPDTARRYKQLRERVIGQLKNK